MGKEQKTKVKPINKTSPEIGIDTDKSIVDNIIEAASVGCLDISSIDALSQSAQNREQQYQLLDSMVQDPTISSVVKQYASDIIQTNDKGQTIWAESDNADVLNYISWLLDSLNIDKHIYQWAYCLVAYGDVYIRLYRKSDVEDDLLFKNNKRNDALNSSKSEKEPLNESVKLRIYAEADHYIPYVQMVDNPGEIFDLQKFGKSYGFVKAPVRVIQQTSDEMYNYLTHYKMRQQDVEIYDAMSFAHACQESTNQRQPETVDIYLENQLTEKDEYDTKSESMTSSYSVKRGQSLLYNVFRVWRELNLLEMSALLNRLTKSSVVRVLNVQVGDMGKEQVQLFMQRLKDKIEQKSALSVGVGMAEYTNPGPIENTIYVPVYNNGQGTISATTIGGDFDPKSLIDLEYFRKTMFGALGVPKEFFGFTDDGGGFNAGSSLTIISAQYGKSIKKYQNIICQLVTDIVNLFLIDRGLDQYVNRYTIRMQAPVTQEELDRRSNTDNRIRYVGDVMQQLSDIEDSVVKLKIYKALIGQAINDPQVMSILQEYIEKLEKEETKKEQPENAEEKESDELPSLEAVENISNKPTITEEGKEEDSDSYLPSADELGL